MNSRSWFCKSLFIYDSWKCRCAQQTLQIFKYHIAYSYSKILLLYNPRVTIILSPVLPLSKTQLTKLLYNVFDDKQALENEAVDFTCHLQGQSTVPAALVSYLSSFIFIVPSLTTLLCLHSESTSLILVATKIITVTCSWFHFMHKHNNIYRYIFP